MTWFIQNVTPSNQSLVFEGAKHNFSMNHKFVDRYSSLITMLQLPGFISHVKSVLVFRQIDYQLSVVSSRIFTHLIACANNNIYRNCDRCDVKTCDFPRLLSVAWEFMPRFFIQKSQFEKKTLGLSLVMPSRSSLSHH